MHIDLAPGFPGQFAFSAGLVFGSFGLCILIGCIMRMFEK